MGAWGALLGWGGGRVGSGAVSSGAVSSSLSTRAWAITSACLWLASAIQSTSRSASSSSSTTRAASADAADSAVGLAAAVSDTTWRHMGQVVSELPARSVEANDDFWDIHWSRQPPQQVCPHGIICTSAGSSRQIGQSSRPVLSTAAFHPFLAFRPSSAAAHLAGLAGAAAARSLAALAAARSRAAAFSASSGPLLAGASPISMAPLCPSPSASLSSSGRISSVLSLAACSSSSACRSRSAASTAAFSANSFCLLSMSTWSLQASSSLPSFARARPHLVPSALNAWHLGSSSTHSPSSCGGRR
mmetsp:Transcript_9487/g.23618  ORF Transcript_9487/g.23618 Transcript_9487/m.23618 type:complete len:303 (+) Transcript_9487:268-1176(+)